MLLLLSSHLVLYNSFRTPWTEAHQTPLSMGFSRQEYWSGRPCPPPGGLPHPGMEPASLMSPPPAGRFFTPSATWEVLGSIYLYVAPWSSFICFLSLTFKSTNFFFFTFFFLIYFWRLITLQYCIGFVLSYIDMSPPWVHMCSPS